MAYLEYHTETKQVVEIYESEPELSNGYAIALSDQFEVGDEFEYTIWVNKVDRDRNLMSYSAVRNNPNAKRLLQENEQLKDDNAELMFKSAMAEIEDENMKDDIAELMMKVAMIEMGGM